MSPITEQEMHEAALSSILNALTRGQPGPDGRPSPRAVGEAQAIAHWLETAPDGALADVHDEDGSDGAEAPKKPVRPVIQPETTGGPLPLADEDDPAGGDEVVYAEGMLSLLYEARHAPGPEGIDIAGKHYTPGEFIPAEAVAQATPAQKRKLTRAAKQAGGDGATTGGQPPQPRKAKSPKVPAKPKAPTVEEAHALIEEAGIQPDREKLVGLANSLSLMTVKDLHEVKKRLGLRAGGRKSELAAKISKLATARITEKEHFAREARKVGVRPQDLHRQMQERMHLHNMHAKQLREVVVQAYRRYPAFADGFRLTRSMRGFRNRDWNAVPGFDTLARSLAGSYPEVLGAHGYDADRGYDANENEAAEKLFELIEAGPAPLLSRREAYEGALDDLQRYRGTRRSRDHEEEFTLYARQEAETSSLSSEQAQAFVEAIRDASSPEELRELAELIQEMADADSPVPDDPAPINPEAAARVRAWLDRKASGDQEEDEDGSTQYARAHAPVGGIVIGGRRFRGGVFIPAKVLDEATPAEKQELAERTDQMATQGAPGLQGEALAQWYARLFNTLHASDGGPTPALAEVAHAELAGSGWDVSDDSGKWVAEKAKNRSFASTQFDLPPELADKVRAFGRTIPDEELAADGRETTIHVTCKYGLHSDSPDEVRELVTGFGSFPIRLGRVSLFPADGTEDQRGGDRFDVVKIEVISPELVRLNKLISRNIECTDTHPRYNPHVTIAYVKPGEGRKYVGADDFDGDVFTASELVFSGKDRTHTTIPLSGNSGSGSELATWYCSLFNDLIAAGSLPDQNSIDAADAELDGSGWGIDVDEETGLWEPREESHAYQDTRTGVFYTRDVSDEARDESGKWTAGPAGSTVGRKAEHKPKSTGKPSQDFVNGMSHLEWHSEGKPTQEQYDQQVGEAWDLLDKVKDGWKRATEDLIQHTGRTIPEGQQAFADAPFEEYAEATRSLYGELNETAEEMADAFDDLMRYRMEGRDEEANESETRFMEARDTLNQQRAEIPDRHLELWDEMNRQISQAQAEQHEQWEADAEDGAEYLNDPESFGSPEARAAAAEEVNRGLAAAGNPNQLVLCTRDVDTGGSGIYTKGDYVLKGSPGDPDYDNEDAAGGGHQPKQGTLFVRQRVATVYFRDEMPVCYASGDSWEPYTGQRGARKGQQGWRKGARVVWGAKPPSSRPRRGPGELAKKPVGKVESQPGQDAASLRQRLAKHAAELTPAQRGNARRALAALRQHHGEAAASRAHAIADQVEEALADLEGSDKSPERKEYLAARLRQKLAQLHAVGGLAEPVTHLDAMGDQPGIDEPIAEKQSATLPDEKEQKRLKLEKQAADLGMIPPYVLSPEDEQERARLRLEQDKRLLTPDERSTLVALGMAQNLTVDAARKAVNRAYALGRTFDSGHANTREKEDLEDAKTAIGTHDVTAAYAALEKLPEIAARARKAGEPPAEATTSLQTPVVKPIHDLTASEAILQGLSQAQWRDAIHRQAIDDNGNIVDPAMLKKLDAISVDQYARNKELVGKKVATENGIVGTVTGFSDDGREAIVTHADGKTSRQWADGLSTVNGHAVHELKKGEYGKLSPEVRKEFVENTARKVVEGNQSLSDVLRDMGLDVKQSMRVRGDIATEIDRLKQERNKPSDARQRAMDKARELQAKEVLPADEKGRVETPAPTVPNGFTPSGGLGNQDPTLAPRRRRLMALIARAEATARGTAVPKTRAKYEAEAAKHRQALAELEGKIQAEQDKVEGKTAAAVAVAAGPASPKFSANVFRGTGRDSKDSVYLAGVGAVLGDDARYFATNPEQARRYGPNVSQEKVELHKPLTLTDANEWRAITDAAGVPANLNMHTVYGGDKSQVEAARKKLTDYLKGQGYDGVVIKMDRTKPTKHLEGVFGHDQVIVFGKPGEKAAIGDQVSASTIGGETHTGTLEDIDNGTAIIRKPDGSVHATGLEALKRPEISHLDPQGDTPGLDSSEWEQHTKGRLSPPPIRADEIPYESAYNAFRNSSHFPEDRARRRQQEYVDQMRADFEHLAKYATTPEKQEMLRTEFERYRQGFREHTLAQLHAASRTASSFITGPANFPVERNRKRLETEHRRITEMIDFRKRALKAIQKKLTPEDGPILSADPGAVDALQNQVDAATALQERMKKVNAYLRGKVSSERVGNDHRAVFASGHDYNSIKAKLVEMGVPDRKAAELLQPDYMGRVGYEDFYLKNNNANIRRIKDRIESLQKMKAGEHKEEKYSGDVKVVEDPDAARIRIHFPGKPDKTVTERLKSNGFRWSPSEGAWQRHLNNGGRYAVQQVLKASGHEKLEETTTDESDVDNTDEVPQLLVTPEAEPDIELVATPEPSSPVEDFSPESAIKISANNVGELRKADVFRVLDWSPAEHRQKVADYIVTHRPELKTEVDECLRDIANP